MAYGVLLGVVALTVVAAIRALLSSPGADEQGVEKSSDPDEPVPGDDDARVQRTPQTEHRASGADLDRQNPEFSRALDLMRADMASPEGGHVFITGKAGTGKSTLIKHFLETTVTASTVVLAPTGVAALSVQGQTVFRFFSFWIDVTPEKVRKKPGKPKTPELYKKLSTIIIDEASMLRADLLDCVDEFLRRHGPRPGEPFGGVRMVFVGDLYQLPPVVPPGAEAIFAGRPYETPYFFSARGLRGMPLQLVELQKVYRQEDAAFIDLLDRIRTASVNGGDIRRLNERVGPDRASSICLTATNAAAGKVNGDRLNELDGEPATSCARIQGDFDKDYYPTEAKLVFKVGAQVMLVNNDSGGSWVNGTIGEIESVGRQHRWVRIRLQDTGRLVDVGPHTWDCVRFALKDGTITTERTGSFTQLPFRLAWAVTIHKSQGQTLKNVTVDLGRGAFAAGQTYVALSRSTALTGIVLRSPIGAPDIFADPRVEKFLAACRVRST